ncbi:MAG: hypothetical protein J5649_08510 [Lachnospiraceae bacterium]|nr:hypothetical protein [Lachnospiraceae bacterium]
MSKEPTKSELLASEISSRTVACVLIQLLALIFFFLAFVWFMNKGVGGPICLAVIGFLWEWLFVNQIKKIKKFKVQKTEEDLHPTVSVEPQYAEALYRNRGDTYDIACELYCRQTGKDAAALTKEEQNIVWDYAFDDFSYLLAWIIEKNFYQNSEEYEPLGEEETKLVRSLLAKIKRHTMLPSEFLNGSDGTFLEDEVKEKARAFVKEYYENTYRDEMKAFAKEHLNAELYGFPFRWEDYEVFKTRIDEAYRKYPEQSKSET